MFGVTRSNGLRSALLVLFLAVSAFAANGSLAQPLVAAARSVGNTLVIDGSNFSATPVVTLGTYVAPLQLVSATNTQITANLPAGIPAGGYLLTVTNPVPPTRTGPGPLPGADEFWVTIGALGVPGPQGPAGPPGPQGPQGLQGPAGAGAAPLNTKDMGATASGFANLASWTISATDAVGGYIDFTIVADDGGTQVVTQMGRITFNAKKNTVTCNLDPTTSLHIGTVDAGCVPGFYSPGTQPGVGIYDSISFGTPAPVVNHRVYFEVHTIGTAAMRLEP